MQNILTPVNELTALRHQLRKKDDHTLIEKVRKGRVETFELADDEHLLGVEWHHNPNFFFSFR